MTETIKQKFRQPFGFYMENLIGGHFTLNETSTLYHWHSYAFEWGLDLPDSDLNQLELMLNLINKGDEYREKLKEMVHEILKGKPKFDNSPLIEAIKRSFSFEENDKILNKKLILLAVSNIVSSNNLELLRIQNHKLIISEVKSQYGPIVDHRIEIDRAQLENLFRLTNNGIDSSLLYCIALHEPAFIEIPFKALYENFQKYPDFNGKEFTDKDWSYHRMRIPKEYRDASKFTKIDRSLYNFNDETSLFKSILNAFPGKFLRLEKLIL